MKVFEAEDQIHDYQIWREQNPHGYILNINTLNPESTRYKNLVHIAAGCQSLNVPPAANQDRPVNSEHPKYCSVDIKEILGAMKSQGLIRTVHACNHCRKKYWNIFENADGFDGWLRDAMQPISFQLGHLFVTTEASEVVGESKINQMLVKYMHGDWGTLSADEWQKNDQAIIREEDLRAIYSTANGANVWIITKGDRSRTAVFLAPPDENDNPITPLIKSFIDEEDLESAIEHIQEGNRSNDITTEEVAFVLQVERGTDELTHTEREQTIRSRIGQSLFRGKLLQRRQCCELCGISVLRLLTASHIKDWSKCESDSERLDPNNGLLLCPNHDKVFDAKLISFDDSGLILISSQLSEVDRILLNLHANQRIELIGEKRLYMAWHRESNGFS